MNKGGGHVASKKNSNRYLKLKSETTQKTEATKHLNFGVFVFVLILAYLIFIMISFAIKEKVNYTIAELGTLSHSNTFSGLVIRNESVTTADSAGEIRYFLTEGARVRNTNTVCGVISDADYVALLDSEIFKANQKLDSSDSSFEDSYGYLQNRIKNYVINQHNKKFNHTYTVRKQLENDISDIRNTVIVQQRSLGLSNSSNIDTLEKELGNSIRMHKATSSGLVSYIIDGMEDITTETFKISDLNRAPEIQDTVTKSNISMGQPIFKVVDNYLWHIVAEIDPESAKLLENMNYKTIHFVEKNIEIVAKIQVFTEDHKTYIKIEADRMLNEFLNERFVDFRIIHENHQGIKIPESAIIRKNFAVIPAQYFGYLNNRYGVYKKVMSEDAPGDSTIDFTSTRLFQKVDDFVYVPTSDTIRIGDVLSFTDPDSMVTTEFIIEKTEDLDGVYVVNKGFADFKFIETTYKDIDYRIVAPYTPYGVRIYDRIATEGITTTEYQTIN
jgi:putative membrane fusion protein